jgi:hypothetical protein
MADDSASSNGVSRGDNAGTKGSSGTKSGNTSSVGGGGGGGGGSTGTRGSSTGSVGSGNGSNAPGNSGGGGLGQGGQNSGAGRDSSRGLGQGAGGSAIGQGGQNRGAGDIGAAGVPGGRSGGQQAPSGGIAGISGGNYSSAVNGSRFGGASTQVPGAGSAVGRGAGTVQPGTGFGGGFGNFKGPGVNDLNNSALNVGKAITDRVPQAVDQGIGSFVQNQPTEAEKIQADLAARAVRMEQLANMPPDAFQGYYNYDPLSSYNPNQKTTLDTPSAFAPDEPTSAWNNEISGMSFTPDLPGAMPGTPTISLSQAAVPSVPTTGKVYDDRIIDVDGFQRLVNSDILGRLSAENQAMVNDYLSTYENGPVFTAAPAQSFVAGDPRVNMAPGSYPAGGIAGISTVAGDPRVNMAPGSYPAAGPTDFVGANSGQFADVGPLSAGDIYAQNTGFVSPNVVSVGETPYVGTPSDFDNWRKGYNPLDGTATAGVLASPSTGTMVAGDPRVNMAPGSYPASTSSMVAGDPRTSMAPGSYPAAAANTMPDFFAGDPRVDYAPGGYPVAAATPVNQTTAYGPFIDRYSFNSPEQVAQGMADAGWPNTPTPMAGTTYASQVALMGRVTPENIISVENYNPPQQQSPSQDQAYDNETANPDAPPTKGYMAPMDPYENNYTPPGPTDYAGGQGGQNSGIDIRPTSGPPPSGGGSPTGDGGGGSDGGGNPADNWFNAYYNNPPYQTIMPTPMPTSYVWDPTTQTYINTPATT